jgi:hypothetical protein
MYIRLNTSNRKGYLTIIGGVLIQMFNGCFFLWANISNYVLSYLYIFDKSVNADAIFYVDIILVMWNCVGY